MARAGISGVAVSVGAAGLYLVYAGIRNVPLLAGLRELAAGRLPAPVPATPAVVKFGARAQSGTGFVGVSVLARPLAGPIGDGFGAPRPGRLHKGVDIAAPTGTPVHAAAAGAVIGRGYDLGAGNYIILGHANGLRTKYFHLSAFRVGHGAPVTQGQVIGLVGSTGNSSGPHLHFEVHENGVAVDPLRYIAR